MHIQDIIKITRQKKVEDMVSTVLKNLRFLFYIFSTFSGWEKKNIVSFIRTFKFSSFFFLSV